MPGSSSTRCRRPARRVLRRGAGQKGSRRGLLDGVPIAIKDVTETRGWPTLNGSLAVDPKGPWIEDAIVVERFRSHGAVIVGKTTTPEFAWKGTTDSKPPRHHPQSLESGLDHLRVERRLRRRGRGRHGRHRHRYGFRGLHSRSGELLQRRRPKAELRSGSGMAREPDDDDRALRTADAYGARCRARTQRDGGPRSEGRIRARRTRPQRARRPRARGQGISHRLDPRPRLRERRPESAENRRRRCPGSLHGTRRASDPREARYRQPHPGRGHHRRYARRSGGAPHRPPPRPPERAGTAHVRCPGAADMAPSL